MARSHPIRVLIVDDSALMRELIGSMLSADPEIEVVGAVSDPIAARERIKQLNPDVLTLDVEMPYMDGRAFLEKIMTLRPMPVVMISSLTQEGAEATVRALELGAVDCVAKPAVNIQGGLLAKQSEIVAKVKAAARARVNKRRPAEESGAPLQLAENYSSTEKLVAIGASTGGVEAINYILHAMPVDSPAILITQHMPESFTASFARRMNATCAISVAEACDGERVLPGHAYIAPGHAHLRLVRSGANYVCRVQGKNRVSGHCPSVDVLFHSVAEAAGKNAIGVILTGMGKDGAEGLLAMRRTGACTLGQDEESCVVYGMPRAAYELGGVEAEVPLNAMALRILNYAVRAGKRNIRI
ncbi:MAG: protein-glutamate methylesterase/protein-glutamine glutaminase [Rhodomicrobium sp.]